MYNQRNLNNWLWNRSMVNFSMLSQVVQTMLYSYTTYRYQLEWYLQNSVVLEMTNSGEKLTNHQKIDELWSSVLGYKHNNNQSLFH